MFGKKWLKKLKLLDFHPKTNDEVKEQSSAGAIVTFFAILIALILLISEITDYLTPERRDTLYVNHNRGEKMNINFRVSFLALPCEVVNVDVTDRVGEEQAGAVAKITKTPFKGDFESVKETVGKNMGWLKRYNFENLLWENLRRKIIPKNDKECLSCYEAEKFPGHCCNNCYQLRRSFVEKGMNVQLAERHPQCIDEAQNGKIGCLLGGQIEVNKVAGNIHIAVGETHSAPGERHHHHWPQEVRSLGFNSSHYISHMSFGQEFPGIHNPLDGYLFVEKGLGQQQYFMQVVPTEYTKSGGEVVITNQFSVTNHHSSVDLNSQHMELPGVFFRYEINPLMIKMVEADKSLSHFLTRLCAVVGGMWVVLGLLYSSMKKVVEGIIGIS